MPRCRVTIPQRCGQTFRHRTPAHRALAVLDDTLATRRREVVRQLKARGIGTSVYYPCPVPLMTYYRDRFGATGAMPNSVSKFLFAVCGVKLFLEQYA